MPKKTQQILSFAFGLVFVLVLLTLAVEFPEPTKFQYVVFRVVLSLAAAGVAAMIPGFFQATVSKSIKASGALAVFVVVYFYNPADLVTVAPVEPDSTEPFNVVLACKTPQQVKINQYNFPFGDIRRKASHSDLRSLISQLPNQLCSQQNSKIFRFKDEKIIDGSSSITATSGGNLGVIFAPSDVVEMLGGDHIAFTKIFSYVRQKN